MAQGDAERREEIAEAPAAEGNERTAAGLQEEAVVHKAPNYYLIWVYLLVLTVAEVAVAFVSHLPEAWLILILLALAVWKAALVAMYYMHLRFEPPRLVMFILSALPLAILLSLVVVTMEGF